MENTPRNGNQGVRRLTLVRVKSANLSFGCMAGVVEGTDTPVTLKLVCHRRQRLLGGWPREGDLVGCEHDVHSVYEPRILLHQEDLATQKLMRRLMPNDLADEYFCIRRPLMRVEGF